MNGFHQWSILTSAYNNVPDNLPHTGFDIGGYLIIGICAIVAGLLGLWWVES